MKYICKKAELETFRDWKIRNNGTDWKDFSGTPEHRELREYLLTEQSGMCCYCEVMIASLEKFHIEHLRPKGNPFYRKDMFSYGNLLASCNEKDSCGIKKHGWYDPEMVSPLDKNCAERFKYALDGRIIPSDETDTWAKTTIDKLGLNCRRLKDRRRSIIMSLQSEGPNPDFLRDRVKKTLAGEKGWPDGFYTDLLHVAETYDIPI